MTIKVSIGKRPPEFDLETDSGERLSLTQLKGHTVVLYFYPVS